MGTANIFTSFFFGHVARLAGSYFPDQGLNPAPAVKARSANHWTASEFPPQSFLRGRLQRDPLPGHGLMLGLLSSFLAPWAVFTNLKRLPPFGLSSLPLRRSLLLMISGGYRNSALVCIVRQPPALSRCYFQLSGFLSHFLFLIR